MLTFYYEQVSELGDSNQTSNEQTLCTPTPHTNQPWRLDIIYTLLSVAIISHVPTQLVYYMELPYNPI